MSMYASFGEGQPTEISSNKGWSQFGDWVDGLDVEKFGEVVHLWEHGWSQNAKVLSGQLASAIKTTVPDKDVRPVAESLISLLAGEEVIVITDGFGSGKPPAIDDLRKRMN